MQILKVIKNHGWTVDRIAEQMGVTKSAVSQRINAEQPTWATINKVCEIVGCQVAEFYEDELWEVLRKRGADLTTIDRQGMKHEYVEIPSL